MMKNFWTSDRVISAIEYGLITVLISLAAIFALEGIGVHLGPLLQFFRSAVGG